MKNFYFIAFLALVSCNTEEIAKTPVEIQTDFISQAKMRGRNIYVDQSLNNNFKDSPPIILNTAEEIDHFFAATDSLINPSTISYSVENDQDWELTPAPDGSGGGGSSEGVVTFQHFVGMGSYISVRFSVLGCQGSNLNSWMSGWQLGASYTHERGYLTSENNTINYRVYGILHYNLFVEGVGTLYSENVSYFGSYNCQ